MHWDILVFTSTKLMKTELTHCTGHHKLLFPVFVCLKWPSFFNCYSTTTKHDGLLSSSATSYMSGFQILTGVLVILSKCFSWFFVSVSRCRDGTSDYTTAASRSVSPPRPDTQAEDRDGPVKKKKLSHLPTTNSAVGIVKSVIIS